MKATSLTKIIFSTVLMAAISHSTAANANICADVFTYQFHFIQQSQSKAQTSAFGLGKVWGEQNQFDVYSSDGRRVDIFKHSDRSLVARVMVDDNGQGLADKIMSPDGKFLLVSHKKGMSPTLVEIEGGRQRSLPIGENTILGFTANNDAILSFDNRSERTFITFLDG